MNDYDRVARVIQFLDEHHTEQPNLQTLADHVGLSPYLFQRLFSRWAAISPKNFLQSLTMSHARVLLRDGTSVLEAALDSSLSGPGRLHDLCVNLEAASPGELKSGGEGWSIAYGFADTPFGTCLVGVGPRGICHLAFVAPSGTPTETAALQENWPGADLRRDDEAASRILAPIFDPPGGGGSKRPLNAFVRGTEFQVRVWRALLQTQSGTLVSYGQLAVAIGQPTATRAVGTSVGRNPVALLIPCHRVIRSTGVIGNYRWGHVRKRAILAWESGGLFAERSTTATA